MSSKAAFVNTLLIPAVRITRVVPTPAKKTTAFEALGIFLLSTTNAQAQLMFPTGKGWQFRWAAWSSDASRMENGSCRAEKSFPRLVFVRPPENITTRNLYERKCPDFGPDQSGFMLAGYQAEQINKRRADAARELNYHRWKKKTAQ